MQQITDKVNFYDVAYVRFDVPEMKIKPPKITERPPRFGNIDEWMKAQNASINEQFKSSLQAFGKTVMDAAQNSIIGERKFRLMNQRDMEKMGEAYRIEKYLRYQQAQDTLDLISLFEKPDTAKLIRQVAIALMGGSYVSIPCAGGGSVSSETGWDGRKKDEDDNDYRLRCWLHAAKTIKSAQQAPSKRKGYRSSVDNLRTRIFKYVVEMASKSVICRRGRPPKIQQEYFHKQCVFCYFQLNTLR